VGGGTIDRNSAATGWQAFCSHSVPEIDSNGSVLLRADDI
jgi:hypothetical protein